MTSLVVLLLRRIQGWAPLTNYSEFWRYEITNRSPLIPSSEIGRITKELERFCVEVKDVVLPEHCPGYSITLLLSFLLIILIFIHFQVAMEWRC